MLEGLPPSTQGYHWPHGITIVTPDRKFLFTCETEADRKEWVEAFQKVVDRPMLPQEYAGEGRSGEALTAPCGWFPVLDGGQVGSMGEPRRVATLTWGHCLLLQWKPTSSISPSKRHPWPEDPGLT